MQLVSFHVRAFRNIIDSDEILVDEHVTCLVGKNESGKSAMLQALHHLNPANAATPLNLLDEYPRWLKKEHEISGAITEARPITATFQLSEAEMESLTSRFGKGVLASDTVEFSRSYAEPDELVVDAQLDSSKFIKPFIAHLLEPLRAKVGSPETSEDLMTALDAEATAAPSAEAGTPEATLAASANEAKEKLAQVFDGSADLTAAINEQLREMLPQTFYFSRYSQLRGRYPLEEVFAALSAGSDDEEVQAAADFLRLARIEATTAQDWDFEASKAELEAISSLLTTRVKEHWHQNNHLRLNVDIEVQASDTPTPMRYLQFRVEDTRHDFSSRLDRRSTGFQWFISFIASFLEFEQNENLILLFDEPGLSLHARAQMDLLETVETRLAKDRQVLYSTHSPFFVRTNRLDRARIAEDQGPERGAVAINDAGKVTDRDTLFPLQAALGYDVAQSLFIGNQNVLVEGVSDFIYLTTISDRLETESRTHLMPSARLLPAGGASFIPTFIALLGSQLDLVVLLDGNTDRNRIENAIAQGRLTEARVLDLGSFAPITNADIEDLFEPAEYLAFYNAALGSSLKLADLKGKDRIVKRIERKSGAEYNHGVVAAYFLRNLDASLASLSPATLDRFEKVIAAINAALPAA
jgi:predicted ATP-dependent endonuclease of OLD family